jgi:hypothetical protein
LLEDKKYEQPDKTNVIRTKIKLTM